MLMLMLSPILGSAAEKGEVVVAWWNLENAFDTVNDVDRLPQFGTDDEFTPGGSGHWTAERYDQKLRHLAQGIRAMNHGKGPDIVGVGEVEHRAVLEDLLTRFLSDLDYRIYYHESPDARGIDVAFFYRSLFEIADSGYRPVDLASGAPTRDIVFAEFRSSEGSLVCIGNHWPSRRGGAKESEPNRVAAAMVCRQIIDSVFADAPAMDIVVMGDFNDTPSDVSITAYLKASADSTMKSMDLSGALYNCMAPSVDDPKVGTYYYRGEWEVIDQFMVSKGLFDNKAFRYRTVEIFFPDFLKEESGKYAGAPFPTYGGRKYLGGYSDHFPIVLYLGAGGSGE